MSRYRLLPSPAQEAVLRDHCGHARYVWNLAVEQHSRWHPGRKSAPGYLEQCRQLTQARAGYPWLAAGFQTVQWHALRDFTQAMAGFFDPENPAGRPSWRKAGRDEGFRIVGGGGQWDVRRVSRHVGQAWVPKAGWVRFHWSRTVPCGFAGNADVNAAINLAAGHAVTARKGDGVTRPVNREPQLLLH
jgi:putative transposase